MSKAETPDACKTSPAARLRRFIEGLGPYQSLILLLVPASLVEPLKLVAVAVAGEGHWITGTVMIVLAYAASLLLVERFIQDCKAEAIDAAVARIWDWFIALRVRTMARFRRA